MHARARCAPALMVALGAALAGCSAGSTSPSAARPTAPAAATAATAASAATPATVGVTLQEWAVVPAAASAASGPVTFEVGNSGPEDIHELVVVRTDLAPGELPTTAAGPVDESTPGVTIVGEVASLSPGARGSVTVELPAGRYVLICNVVEDFRIHYKPGMRTGFDATQ